MKMLHLAPIIIEGQAGDCLGHLAKLTKNKGKNSAFVVDSATVRETGMYCFSP